MMIRDKIFKLHRHRSSSDRSLHKFDFSFSNLHARQVPKGWDKLSVSLVSAETGKTVSKSGKASVRNGNCKWTETWSQSMWITPDDISNKQEQFPFKFIVTMGSARSSILGEAAVNPACYKDAKASTPISLPLRKCNHGTVLQLEIKCLTAIRDNEFKDMPIYAEEETAEYNNMEIKSEETSLPRLSSYHSFGSTEDSLGRQESIDSRSSASCGSYSFCDSDSPYNLMISGSGKTARNQKDDLKQFSHDNTASVQLAASCRNSLQAKDTTSKELIAEARMWEQNSQNLKIDLEMSRKEFSDQTQQIANLKMELHSLGTERDGLMQEIKRLEVLLQEFVEKEKATESLMLQVRDMDSDEKILKEELRIQKESNDNMSFQLNKTQESNIQLVSILQEMEETVEKQKLEIKNLLEVKSNSPYIENQQNLEEKLQQLHESEKNMENTNLHLENIIREKTHEIELERGHRTQALLVCEEKWKNKSREQEAEIAYLKAELSRLLSAEVSKTTEIKAAADCDLIKENETLKKKIQQLERDCKDLTEENMELLYKLKSSGTSSISGPILSSSSVKGQLSEQLPGGCEFEVSKGELLSAPFQDSMAKKKIIAETAASESKQKTCDQEENLAQMEFHSQVKDNASSLNAEINSCCIEVQEHYQRTEIAAMPSECQLEENCHGGFTHENVPVMFQSSEYEDIYTLLNTLCHPAKDEQANAVLKKFQFLRYRLDLCLDGSKHIEDGPKTTVKDACEVQDEEKDDLPKENTPCCCQRLEDLNKLLEGKVQNLSSDSLAKNSEILELKTECLKKDAEIEALRHHQTDLRTQISDLQMSKCLMEERTENMQQEFSATSKSLNTSTNDLMFLHQCICGGVSKMASDMKSLELESDKINLHELEKENVYLSERVSGLEAQLRHLTDAMEFNRLELQHSGNRVVSLQDKIKELEHEKESQKLDMKEKLLEMHKRWLDAQEECEYLKKVNPKLQATTENLMEECRLLQNLNTELRQQKLKLYTSHSALEAELWKSQYSFSTCLQRIVSLDSNFSSVLEEIESKEKILKSKLDYLHIQTKEHGEKLLVEDCTLHEMSPENIVEVEKLQEQVQSLMVRMSDLMSDLGTSKVQEGTLAANCEKLLRTMEHLVSNEVKLKHAINELESKLLSSECQMLQMTEENSILNIQLHTLPLLQEEVLDLKGALSWMKFESERLQVTLQLKYEDCEELKEEKMSLLQEISCMQKAVAEAEECKFKKIALEEKVLRLEGDLTAKEVTCSKVSELKNELHQLRRSNSQFLWKIKSLQFEKEDCLKQVKSLEEELSRQQSDNQREDDDTIPTLEELKLSKAEEEDFSKHQSEIITQSPQSEKYLKVQKIQGNSQQDGNKESNYIRDLQEIVAKSVSVIQYPGDTVAQTIESNCIHESHLISLSSIGKDENMQKISQLEAELQEIRDRYLNMSLKYAEVEDQREQLVMTLKAIPDQKTARGYRNVSYFWSAGSDM